MMVTGIPSRLVWRTVPLLAENEMEEYAAEHPWRIHLAAFLFRWGCIAHELIGWGLFLLLLYFVSSHVSVVVWGWVYVVSSLVFLQWFFNAIQLKFASELPFVSVGVKLTTPPVEN